MKTKSNGQRMSGSLGLSLGFESGHLGIWVCVVQICSMMELVPDHSKDVVKTPLHEGKADPTEKDMEAAKGQFECSSLRKRLIFDAIGVQFHANVFLWQLLVHTFIFLSPLLKNRHGQGFRYDLSVFSRFNILPPLMTYLMVVLFFSIPSEDQHMMENYIWVPLLFFVVHRVVLSLKYATLSETEYERFNRCPNAKLSVEYIYQMQLFSGWFLMEPEVMYFELGAASARMGERINNIHLIIPGPTAGACAFNQFLYWNAFVRGQAVVFHGTKPAPELKRLPCGNYAISVYDICLAIIRGSQKVDAITPSVMRFIQLVVMSVVLIGFVPIMVDAGKLRSPWLSALFLWACAYVTWVYGKIFFTLLYIATFDAMRQAQMVGMLHCMIRLTELSMHANLTMAAQVTSNSQSYAEDRITAILSMNDVKHITCDHFQAQGDVYCAEAMECKAFYTDTVPITMASVRALPILEGAMEEDELFKTNSVQTSDEQPKETTGTPVEDVRADRRRSAVLGERYVDESSSARIPRITFEFPQNVLAWLYARLAIQNFGDRFRYRMDAYLACTVMLAVLIMVYAMSTIAQSDDRIATVTTPFFIQTFLVQTLMICYLILHCHLAAAVNKELERQRRTLGARKLRIQCFMNRVPDGECKEALEMVMGNLDIAMETAELNNELKPFRIFGMAAQDGLTISVISTALTFYSVVASLVMSTQKVNALSAVQ